ncbi:MAG: LysR family transcriptional regulator [Anaerolineaceae bacterium]|nr:LysR family transcriptional regulator [Anaerolineaceae bacterium]
MELAQIEAFVRTAREGNFTKAAEVLNLTQPAVSTRVALLEARLGGPLFERRGRVLALTPLGEQFLPYAERILAVLADGVGAVRNYQNGRAGEVKIAAPTPFLLAFLVESLADFRYQHPTVDVLIRERNKTTIQEMLHDYTVTLGLVNAPVLDRGLQPILRLDDRIRAVAAAAHPLAQRHEPLHMDDLYQHTVFRVSMFPEMTAFIDAAAEQGRQGSGGAVIAIPMVMARRLVTLGQGVTFLPEHYVKMDVESGDLVYLDIVDMPSLVSQAVLVTRRDRELDKVHREFVRIFRARWRDLIR